MLAPKKRFANAETGATSLEYGLVAAGIAIAPAFGSFDETAQLAATLCVAHARTCSKAPQRASEK